MTELIICAVVFVASIIVALWGTWKLGFGAGLRAGWSAATDVYLPDISMEATDDRS